MFDPKLNFNRHIEIVTNKSSAVLQFVKRQSSNLKPENINLLYIALVRSNLKFACSIWSPYHKTHISQIESVQRKIVMFLNGDTSNRSQNNYVLTPYIDRSMKFE